MDRRWRVRQPDPDAVRLISRKVGVHPAVAAALVNRDIGDPETAGRFLSPSPAELPDPFALKDIDRAVARILDAIRRREKILVFGDYDADGVTATAVLVEFLKDLNAECEFYIPHRVREGYGFSPDHAPLFRSFGLIITVDCGISSHEAVEAARREGAEVIVTDHHEPEGSLPKAVAVVNPKRPDCPSGYMDLAGVGVAFFLCMALRAEARKQGMFGNGPEPNLKKLMDLVAIGTIADMVRLTGANRVLAATGLAVLRRGRRPGLFALMEAAGVDPESAGSHSVAFGIAPRINAAGRLDHARKSVELLLTPVLSEAKKMARALDRLNRERQEAEQEIFDQALEMAREKDTELALVLFHPSWHEGVIGIVASRLARRYFRPVLMLCDHDEALRGSGRSIEGIDLFACLSDCQEYLSAFGGHFMAAGLSLPRQNLDAFVPAFLDAVTRRSTPEAFIPSIPIDYNVKLSDVGEQLADEIATLAPFGVGNPEPLFWSGDLLVRESRMIAEKHLRLSLGEQDGQNRNACQAIWFSARKRIQAPARLSRACFRIQWNLFRGNRSVQLVVEDMD